MSGPLHGIRVLDLTRVLAGPWASQLLADYGADVIKIERPGRGDDTRQWGPPWLKDAAGNPTSESAYFLSTNRNKRSVTVNLAHPAGRALIAQLAGRVDVLLENFRVGTMAKYGLDAASLRGSNAALIYCSISAYGQCNSRAQQPGYDAMIQAEGGLMSITGAPDEEGGSPQKVGVAIADIMTGMYAVTAILAALEARHRSGRGQYIDLALYQSQVAWLANQNMNYLLSGQAPGRLGTAHPNIVPYQAFAAADDYLLIAVGNDRQFMSCMRCLALEHLADDARFATNRARVQNRLELIGLMTAALARRPAREWVSELSAAGVPAGMVNDIEDIFTDAFADEIALLRQLPHPLAGQVPTVANPVHFATTPVEYRQAPPLLGQHTDEVLAAELGYTAERIAALRERGAI